LYTYFFSFIGPIRLVELEGATRVTVNGYFRQSSRPNTALSGQRTNGLALPLSREKYV